MIGTITFHWAINYGAVLQAYALQKWLIQNGYETELINYIPAYEYIKDIIVEVKNRNFPELQKAVKLNKFKKKYLNTTQKYFSKEQLKKASSRYHSIITGSDQLWNPYFTFHGDHGKKNLCYFLNFAGNETKRIAYAVSFGTENVSEEYKRLVREEVKRFSSISVREKSGVSILQNIGITPELVCDPTLLLQKDDYLNLLQSSSEKHSVFEYTLHSDEACKACAEYMASISNGTRIANHSSSGLEEWLGNIDDAQIVVTNSFHGIMLSLILNKPFVAVTMKKSGMNDRIITLLSQVNLENRIVEGFDEVKIQEIYNSDINWELVNKKLENMRHVGEDFLRRSLQQNESDE